MVERIARGEELARVPGPEVEDGLARRLLAALSCQSALAVALPWADVHGGGVLFLGGSAALADDPDAPAHLRVLALLAAQAIRAERSVADAIAAGQAGQEQLLLLDRLAAVGMLAAGVAHEINNPMTAVVGNLELATLDVAEMPGLEGVAEALADATTGAQRVLHILRDLRVFARTDAERPRAVDLRPILESTVRMALPQIRHKARLDERYGKAPPVLGTPPRLGQVFLNLLVNAQQALDEERSPTNEVTITLRTGSDGWAVVEVRDNGPGIPPEILTRLFTPFLTTKPAGVGSGLGLTISRRIVADCGGRIEVRSVPGDTVFTVRLPPTDAPAAPGPHRPSLPPVEVGRSTVLVVDDDAMVVQLVRRALEADHEVASAATAGEALDHIGRGERFDLVLCDVMMPGWGGIDLFELVRQRVPEQAERFVFVTGGASTPRVRDFLARAAVPYLEKPFDATTLRAVVYERLASAGGPVSRRAGGPDGSLG